MWSAARAAPPEHLVDWLQPGVRAALGLGGDPFFDPLAVAPLSSGSFERAATLRLRGETCKTLPPGTRGLPDGIGSTSITWSALSGARWRSRDWLGAVDVMQPRWESSWRGSQGVIRVGSSQTRTRMRLSVPAALPGLAVEASAPIEITSPAARSGDLGAAIGYQLGIGAVRAVWERSRFTDQVRSDLSVGPIAMVLNARAERYRADLAFRGRRAAIHGSAEHTDFLSEAGRSTRPAYQLEPGGRGRLSQVAGTLGSAVSPGLVARWTEITLDLDADASWGGQRFARLSYARADLRSLLVGVRNTAKSQNQWLADVEWADLSGSARGWAESWPFTSTLVDLFGQRSIGRAKVDAHWYRIHVGTRQRLGGVPGQLGVSWYDVSPSASLSTWRPTILMLGVSDLQRSVLEVNRLQLASVSLGAEVRWGAFSVDLEARQMVFARAFNGSRPSVSGGPGTAHQGSDTPRENKHWPGGTTARIVINRAL